METDVFMESGLMVTIQDVMNSRGRLKSLVNGTLNPLNPKWTFGYCNLCVLRARFCVSKKGGTGGGG